MSSSRYKPKDQCACIGFMGEHLEKISKVCTDIARQRPNLQVCHPKLEISTIHVCFGDFYGAFKERTGLGKAIEEALKLIENQED